MSTGRPLRMCAHVCLLHARALARVFVCMYALLVACMCSEDLERADHNMYMHGCTYAKSIII